MLRIRDATSEDVPLIFSFIRELAEYYHEPESVSATEGDIRRDGFTQNPKFRVVIAESDGVPAGMAFYFDHYSTWKGRKGIFVEDMIIRPELRGKGIGKALMIEPARRAIEEGYYGMRWEILEWNKSAIEFYKSLDAIFREGGRTMQLMGDEMRRLANSD